MINYEIVERHHSLGLKPVDTMVEVDPKGPVAVRVGESLKVKCRVGYPLLFCRVEIPGEPSMNLQPNQAVEDGIAYYGKGLENGECGVSIQRVKEIHDGAFKCALTINGTRAEIMNGVKIIVARSPQFPVLRLTTGAQKDRFKNGEKLDISCSALGGRPPANVSLYLDDELLASPHDMNIINTNVNDESRAEQNVSYALKWNDNGKMLRCVSEHIAMSQPQEAKKPLEVYYPPQPQPTINRFGFVIGRPGIINVTVNANPRPELLWSVNDEKILEGRLDKTERLQSSSAREVGKGEWLAELRIETVQKSDTEKEYYLEARNDEGAQKYHIRLSTSPEPEGVDLDAGYIIGIVVGILVLLLLAFLVIFARATGRWCFAGGSTTRNIGESSDTESAGRYSRTEVDGTSGRPRRPRMVFSQLFRRNKDKVAGADTDTMRTVVTVDDEKVPESTEPAEKPTSQPEGGLVYAELDLAQREQNTTPRRVSADKTEYAEILYTKSEDAETPADTK
ncbi:fasciclin-3 isoform X2 [Chelonus insularis]|uniref:fasciclin-3 isoform X2 n=1 Tax=Chelonus insularis TaxID=460826 RepID=UPI00158DB9D7|nr:fasciclin-3 isoform X2 [Chelonus insularis]